MLHGGRPSALAVAAFVLSLSFSVPAAALSTDAPSPPSVEFGDLYHAVEMAGIFVDQKIFADAVPNEPPPKVMADYERLKQLPGLEATPSLRNATWCSSRFARRTSLSV